MSKMLNESLTDLIGENKEVFFEELNDVIKPAFKGLENPKQYDEILNMLNRCMQRPLFPRQARLCSASIEHLRQEKSLILSAEMGTGKTVQALAIALDKRYNTNFILCPPHLVSKWADEIRTVYRDDQVKHKIVIVARWEDLVPYTRRDLKADGCKYFFIASRESAKLSYRRKEAYNLGYKQIVSEEMLDGEALMVNRRIAIAKCPKCGSVLHESESDMPIFEKMPYKCSAKEIDSEGNEIEGSACGEVLRDVDRDCSEKMRTRISIAEYIKKQWPKGKIDLLIADELHEYKGGDTGQGNALAMIVAQSKKIVGLTGTLLNGYASSLFYILYRLRPHLMKHTLNLDYNQVKSFVEIYGAHEEIVEATEVTHEGVVTRMGKRIALKEKPKISPYLLSLLLDSTIFLRLDEIKMEEDLSLPSYTESIELVEMDEEYSGRYYGYIGSISYRIRKDKRFLGNLANDAISVPDLPYSVHSAQNKEFYYPYVVRNESEIDERLEMLSEVNLTPPREDIKVLPLTAKEVRLIELVKEELSQGRKCLVYIHFSNKGVGDTILSILEKEMSSYRVGQLKATIDARKRQKWIEDNPFDVLICNPELVKTGLDLLEYPTIIFYETSYNVFTLKQASRRSWRIGQREAVKVMFMAYSGSPQHKALELIGAKVNAANSLEGRLSGDDDLSSMADDDDNIQLALAKAILNGESMSGDIEMNKIENFGDREWDVFETYYKERLKEFKVPEVENKTKEAEQNIFVVRPGIAEEEKTEISTISLDGTIGKSDSEESIAQPTYGFQKGDFVFIDGQISVMQNCIKYDPDSQLVARTLNPTEYNDININSIYLNSRNKDRFINLCSNTEEVTTKFLTGDIVSYIGKQWRLDINKDKNGLIAISLDEEDTTFAMNGSCLNEVELIERPTPKPPKPQKQLDLFAFDSYENNDDSDSEKIVIYKTVKKGKRYVEERMLVNKHEIDAMVSEDDNAKAYQLSLF